MSLSRKQKIIIFAMILVACAIGGGVFYKRHSAQKAKNRLFENPFPESIRRSICKVEITQMRHWLWMAMCISIKAG